MSCLSLCFSCLQTQRICTKLVCGEHELSLSCDVQMQQVCSASLIPRLLLSISPDLHVVYISRALQYHAKGPTYVGQALQRGGAAPRQAGTCAPPVATQYTAANTPRWHECTMMHGKGFLTPLHVCSMIKPIHH
jgi:hypothetical protein